jgi:predicted peptidase
MRNIFHWLISLSIIILSVSCKKNADKQTTRPVQPPVVTDINLVAETKPAQLTATTLSINSNIGGFYSSVPANYNKTTKSYPLIVAIHGGGQYGNGGLDLPVLLNDGIPELLDEGIFPPNFVSNGINYSFIVIAPQLKQFPVAQEIKDVIDYARKNFRVDSTRIYMFGLSNGASASCLTAATYAYEIAAIVPASGEYNYDPVCSSLAKNKVAIWAFHNSDDPVDNIQAADNFISSVNSFSPVIAPKFTVFTADVHDSWTKAISPGYKENNMNIYEWMLQYSK